MWNKTKLRRGERVDCESGKRTKKMGRARGHPNAWTLSGTIRFAFGRIGELARGRAGTRRPLDAISVVSLAADKQLRESCEVWLQARAVCKPSCRWVFVGRAHDTTPMRVAFGALRNHGKFKGARGMTELLAQTVQLCWPVLGPDEFVTVMRLDLPVLPRFLETTRAVTMLRGLDCEGRGLYRRRLRKTTNAALMLSWSFAPQSVTIAGCHSGALPQCSNDPVVHCKPGVILEQTGPNSAKHNLASAVGLICSSAGAGASNEHPEPDFMFFANVRL